MRTNQLQTRVSYFISALIELSVFICLQMIVFADVTVRLLVGPSFLEGIRVIQIVILAVPFYFVYAGLRGVIDAAAVKAFNTRNIYIAGLSFLLCIALAKIFLAPTHLLAGLAAASVAGFAVLAGCTLRTVAQLFEINIDWPRFLPGFVVAALFGVLSFLLHDLFQFQPGAITLSAYEIALSGIYLFVLGLINAPWVRFLRSSLFTYPPSKEQAGD